MRCEPRGILLSQTGARWNHRWKPSSPSARPKMSPVPRAAAWFNCEGGYVSRSCSYALPCSSISKEILRITSLVVLKNPAYAKYNICSSPISSEMKLKISANASEETRSYTQLQQQIHDALRVQHPDWVEPNGDCPTCESYESRLAELLRLSSPSEHRSAA